MHATQSPTQARPWWCESWSWLLMAEPFAAMIGCGVTIWLAILYPDVAIHDNIVHHGSVVEKMTVTPTHGIHTEAR